MEESRPWGWGSEEGVVEIDMVDLINEDGRRRKDGGGKEYNRRLEPHHDLLVLRACERDLDVDEVSKRTELWGNCLYTFRSYGGPLATLAPAVTLSRNS